MKRMLYSGLILVLLLASLPSILAQPTPTSATIDNAATPITVMIPEHVVQITENVFSLGTSEADGKIAEGFLFIHYREEFAKPPWAGNGKDKGNKETEPYAILGKGVKWKTTEPYVLDPTTTDDVSDTFVINTIIASFDTWENPEEGVTYNIFGSRVDGEVDGADTLSPDNKNELFFGLIEDEGVIAVTIVWGYFRGPPQSREIIEYDMVFDDEYTWGYAGPTNEEAPYDTSIMDLQNIATHELGHALGLADLYDDTATEQTMYGYATEGETKKRTLAAGDIAGVKELYG
jgi:hypothetical protein